MRVVALFIYLFIFGSEQADGLGERFEGGTIKERPTRSPSLTQLVRISRAVEP